MQNIQVQMSNRREGAYRYQQPATQLTFTFRLGPVTEEKLFTFMTSRR